MGKKSIYFKNLDSIRFIAAMMVFLQHAVSPAFKYLNLEEGSVLGKVLKVISSGGTGVSIFFVLSGFLITYLIISEVETTGKINIRNFYLRRFLRIWPLYFAVVIFSFILYPGLKEMLGLNNPLGSNIFYHLTFLSNFDVINILENCYGLDAMSQNITWSVSIEEQFYLFWPLIFIIPKKYWLYPIIGLAIGSLYFRFLNKENDSILYFHTFSVLIDLIIGGLFALLVKNKKSIREAFKNTNTISHLVLFCVTFLVLYNGTNDFFGDLDKILGRVVTATLFASIIVSQALTVNDSPLCLSKFSFGNKWGKVTYGIYLLHPIAITLVDVSFRLAKIDYQDSFAGLFGTSLLMFILTLIISWFSYNYYEKYFLKLKNRLQIVKSQPPTMVKKS